MSPASGPPYRTAVMGVWVAIQVASAIHAGIVAPPACGRSWTGPHSTVDTSTGSARLLIAGKPVVPIWVKVGGEDPLEQGGYDRWAKVQFTLDQATASGGVPIVAFGTDRLVRNSSAYEGGTDWMFSDVHPFDNRTASLFDRIVAHAPTALLYPTVYPFFDHHGAQFSGPNSCVVAGTPCDQVTMQDIQNTSNMRVSFPNVPSAAWADAAAAAVVRLMCYLDQRFPGKIFGLQLDGLETGEWFQPGMGGNGASAAMYGDYSNATLAEWCAQAAGGGATECAIPSVVERDTPTVGNSLLGGANSHSPTAFNQWLSTRTVKTVSTIARAAKQASGGAAFTAYYYGYLFELAGSRLAGSGHLAVGEFLREAAIDAMLSPYAYAPDARNFTMPLLGHGLLDSANLHGKLHIIEDDSRTGLCDAAAVDPSCTGDGIVRTKNVEQMIAKARTNAVTAALRHVGLYFYDIPGDGWYGRPDKAAETRQFWNSVRAVRERYANFSSSGGGGGGGSSSSGGSSRNVDVDNDGIGFEPQVALLVDDLSAARFPLTGGAGVECTDRPTGESTTVNLTAVQRGWFAGCSLNHLLHSQPQHALAWIGSPVRTYLVSDVLLHTFPAQSLRFVIFANAIQIPPSILAAVKAKLTDKLPSGEKRTLLWVWAPSVLDPTSGELDEGGPSDIVGMGLKMGGGAKPLETTMADGSSFGSSTYAVSPWFMANPEQQQNTTICGPAITTKVLGRYSHGGAASVVHSSATACNLLFSGSPGLPASTYRQFAEAAGVHQFLSGPASADVVVEASGHAIFLHCGRGDAPCDGLTLHLPERVAALFGDDLDGRLPDVANAAPLCTSCASLSHVALPPGGVRVYWLSFRAGGQ